MSLKRRLEKSNPSSVHFSNKSFIGWARAAMTAWTMANGRLKRIEEVDGGWRRGGDSGYGQLFQEVWL